MPNAGNQSCEVTLQRPVTTRDATYNSPVPGWEDVRTAWVSIDPRFGKERFYEKQMESTVTHVMRGDFLDWQDVKGGWRVIHEGRVFQVQSVRLDYDRRIEAMVDVQETDEDPSEESP